MAVFGTVVAVVAGLLAVLGGSDGSHDGPAKPPGHQADRRNQGPFEQALADLATARGLRYRDTTVHGITERDITVTPSGTLFGSMGESVEGFDQEVLRIGGKTFTRRQEDPHTPGTWTVDADESESLDPLLGRFPPPAVLARDLSAALDEPRTRSDPNDSDDPEEPKEPNEPKEPKEPKEPINPDAPPLTVDGVPALRADTSSGSLFVTKDRPYRVLRWEPLQDDGSQGMALHPLSGDQADEMYDTLETNARQLTDAVDRGVEFTLDTTDDNVSCDVGGCSVTQQFTGALTSGATTRLVDGRITVVMHAAVTIDGRAAGRCTSPRVALPAAGSSVSGTLSCSVPGAGAVFAAVVAEYRARAEAESSASGRWPVLYRVPCVATPVIGAVALSAREVDGLVERVKQERRDGKRRPAGRQAPVQTVVVLQNSLMPWWDSSRP
ncbi:hypothetical protein [Streptomyces sp. NPDC000410]|uniref:hypothetical protein n=1 Tax=Streptomyces sp. NPDC000410 TaxID=3154254 RepID=UPI00331B331E